MRQFYIVEPEVAGGWGPNTVFTRTLGAVVQVHKLHYLFEGWLGDELLESTPCFIVSERLEHAIKSHGLTGAEFEDVEVSTSREFQEQESNKVLPQFRRLKPTGTAGVDDFGMAEDLRLIMSETALGVVRGSGTLKVAVVSAFA